MKSPVQGDTVSACEISESTTGQSNQMGTHSGHWLACLSDVPPTDHPHSEGSMSPNVLPTHDCHLFREEDLGLKFSKRWVEVTLELTHSRQKEPCYCYCHFLFPFSPNLHSPLFSVCSGCLDFERQVEVKFRLDPVCTQKFGKGNWTEIQLLPVQVGQYFPGQGRKDWIPLEGFQP